MKIKAKFENGIPDGMTISLDGQLYRYVGMAPYETKTGNIITLGNWETKCATCGQPITVQHTEEITFSFVRRCQIHRNTGKRVTSAELEASK